MNTYHNMNTGLDGNDDGFPHTLSQTRGVKRCLTFISNDEQHVKKKKCSVTEMNSHVVSVDHGVVGNKKQKTVCSDESLLTTIQKDKGMLCHSEPQHMSKDNNCICTCCNAKNLSRRSCIIFNAEKYNMSDSRVKELLANRVTQRTSKELICKECHEHIDSLHVAHNPDACITVHDTHSPTSPLPSCASNCSARLKKFGPSSTTNSPDITSQEIETTPVSSPFGTQQLQRDIEATSPLLTKCNTNQVILDKDAQHPNSPTEDNDRNDGLYICTCCRAKESNRQRYVFFSLNKYDQDNSIVKQALQFRFISPYMKEMICKKCHNHLKRVTLPKQAVASLTKSSPCNPMKCIACCCFMVNKMQVFRRPTYGINPKLDSALNGVHIPTNAIICLTCHTKFTMVSMHLCIGCGSFTQKQNTVIFDCAKFPSHCNIVVATAHESVEEKRVRRSCHKKYQNSDDTPLACVGCGKLKYKRNTVIYNCLKFPSHSKIALKDQHQSHKTKCICASCHKKCKVSQHTCLVCSRCVPAESATVYSSANYDFKSFIVSCCIPQVQDGTAEEKYICNSCHSTLATCTDETPSVPKHVKNPVLCSAANFLMSLSELPRYVCTCCHHMLFPRTVAKFNMSDYDMTNAIVRKCLSHCIALNFATENDLSVFILAAKNMSARGMN